MAIPKDAAMLTGLQRKKLTRYFRLYDVNQDGLVGAADFERVVESVRALHEVAAGSEGHRALEASFRRRWEGLRRAADVDGDGQVALREWLEYWAEVLESEDRFQTEVASLVARLFELFDTDEDGLLGPDEFCAFYGVYGLGSAMARRVFVDLDADGDGVISRDQLAEIGEQFYRSTDRETPANRLFGPFE